MNDEEFDYEKLVGYKKDLKYEYGFFIKFNEKLAFIGEIDDIKKIME